MVFQSCFQFDTWFSFQKFKGIVSVIADALFNDEGPTYIPPVQRNYTLLTIVGATALIAVGFIMYQKKQKKMGKKLIGSSLKLLSQSLHKIAAT